MKFSCETHRGTYSHTVETSSGFLSDRIAQTSVLKEWEPDGNYRNIKKKIFITYSFCSTRQVQRKYKSQNKPCFPSFGKKINQLFLPFY